MTNFSIIYCLFLISRSALESPSAQKIPLKTFLIVLIFMFISFFWDEPSLLLYPAVLFMFPGFVQGRLKITLFVLLFIFTLLSYFYILPLVALKTGHGFPNISTWSPIPNSVMLIFSDIYWKVLPYNSKLLFLDSMGIMKFSNSVPLAIKAVNCSALAAWAVLAWIVLKSLQDKGSEHFTSSAFLLLDYYFSTII